MGRGFQLQSSGTMRLTVISDMGDGGSETIRHMVITWTGVGWG